MDKKVKKIAEKKTTKKAVSVKTSLQDLVMEQILNKNTVEEKPKKGNFFILNKNCMHNGKIYDKGTKIYNINPDYQIFKAVNER